MYQRVTLSTDDAVQALEGARSLSQVTVSSSRGGAAPLYDLIAVRPLSDKVFQQVRAPHTCHAFLSFFILINGKRTYMYTKL